MRGIWLLAVCVAGCYEPTPVDGLACSETQQCPIGQSCDLLFDQCASLPLCQTPSISSSFPDDNDPCGPWGQAFGLGSEDAGPTGLVLDLVPPNGSTGCQRADDDVTFGPDGVWVEVTQVPAGGNDLGFVTDGPEIDYVDGMLSFGTNGKQDGTEVPYDPVAMRWWRVRPEPDRLASIGEYSADGIHWTMIGKTDYPAPDTVTLQIVLVGDLAVEGMATVAGMNVCPPGTEEPAI